MDGIQEFRAAMLAAGLAPPEVIEPGKFHRFPGVGKSKGNTAGWCRLFDDQMGGVYGCFASGLDCVWQAIRDRPPTKAEQEAFRKRIEEEREAREEEQRQAWETTATEAESLLSSATGDPRQHPYAIRKEVDLGALVKRGAWPQRGWDDALLVPLYGTEGKIWSIEAISPDGLKDSLKGSRRQGVFHPFGQVRGARRVLIAEGVADAAVGHAVAGASAIAAMGKGNLAHAARFVRTLAPDAEICILADNDAHLDTKSRGLTHAIAAAKQVGAYVALPELDGKKCDFWDIWHERGEEAVKHAISQANWFDPPLPEDYVSAASFDSSLFSRLWLVEGFVENGRAYEFFGQWKCGKTLAVMDLCCHASLGLSWAGRRSVPTIILWVAGESLEDVKRRICAWRLFHGISRFMPFFIRQKPVHMDDPGFAAKLATELEEIKRLHPKLPVLVVLDTVARCLSPSANENSIESMGGFVNNLLDFVVRPTGATAINIHHSGHSDTERGRGHSSFAAALDGTVKIGKNGDAITVTSKAMRSSAGTDSFTLLVQVQRLPGEDNFGNPVEEPVLTFEENAAPHQTKRRLSRKEDAVLTSLNRAIEAEGVPPSAAIKSRFGGFGSIYGRNRKVVELAHWRAEAYHVLDTDGDTSAEAKKKAFQRARTALHNKGYVECMDDFWWPLFDDPEPNSSPPIRDDLPIPPLEPEAQGDCGYGSPSGQDGTNRDKCPDVSLKDSCCENRDNRDTAGQNGTDVPTSPPTSGRDGTHSFRSVPPVPVGEGEHWDRAPEESSEASDGEWDGAEDEIVEGVV